MLKTTDLEAVKTVAKTFLYFNLEENKDIPIFVDHPYTTSNIVSINNEIVNLLNSKYDLQKWRKYMEEVIDSKENYNDFSYMITKPYRSAFFKHTYKYVNETDLAKYLKYLWQTCDYVNQDINISRSEYVKLFKKCPRNVLMTEEELKVYEDLSDVITIYRGVNKVTNHPKDGLSWTTRLKTATWFANRYDKDEPTGTVYVAEIKKEDILAFFEYEKEILVNYKKLINLRTL